MKLHHETLSEEQKQSKNKKISDSIKRFNESLSVEERKQLHSNNVIRLTAFDNLSRFSDLILLFDEEFYYNNKYLPVECVKCNHKWTMTKSTSLVKTICKKCHPSKHKTQTVIYDYVTQFATANENDKTLSKEIDIMCRSFNFGIEYDGIMYHSIGKHKSSMFNNYCDERDVKNKHVIKTELCESNNIQLFHIFENEWLNPIKQSIWKSVIDNKLKRNDRIFARKCTVGTIDNSTCNEFLENNHLQGRCNASIRLGLFYGDDLVQVMTFSKSRYNKSVQYELIRLCSRIHMNVVGGAGKLLKYFERTYSPTSIISYANRRWSMGNVYTQLGFDFVANSNLNYFYFKVNENILYSREQFQKHKLKDKLEHYDSSLTETMNMFNNNYRKIYDCGNKTYIKTFSKT